MSIGHRIDILLGTFNGERYLKELLDSILNQSNTTWRLLARDDGSTDGTLSILEAYERAHPEKICLVRAPLGNLGAVRNFATLIECSEADYIMFCDQDDVWLPDKVQALYGAIIELELKSGPSVPALVHSDLTVVDRDLRLIHPSYVRHQWLDPTTNRSLNRLLIQNVVTGCATIMNWPLKRIGSPVPAQAAMHDWWFALVAAAFGATRWLPESNTLYRQHDGNLIGATRWNSLFVAFAGSPMATFWKFRNKMRTGWKRSQQQASAFLKQYGDRLSATHRDTVQCYASLASNNFVMRRYYVCRFRFFSGSTIKDLVTMAFV